MSVAAPLLTDDRAYTAVEACRLTGASYRQLDYWARTRLVVPSVREARGSGGGMERLYSLEDVQVVEAIVKLLKLGVSLQALRRGLASMDMRRFINEQMTRLEGIKKDYESNG